MPPSKIFIVPFRDRDSHKLFFERYMKFILEEYEPKTYEIFFSHQKDTRKFNRGAIKNIGFLAMKEKYPNDYKNITFIFNDIDTIPYDKNVVTYETTVGKITHHYGVDFTLGGIVVIKGIDFEKINGYPNYWEWGAEDNGLQTRAKQHKIIIDRGNFFQIGDKRILQLFDGVTRQFNLNNIDRLTNDKGSDGIKTIHNIKYKIENNMIQITDFKVPLKDDEKEVIRYDIRKGHKIHKNDYLGKRKPKMKMNFS